MSWGKLYGANDAGRNVKMQESMIPMPPNKPYLFDGQGYDTIQEMEAARDKARGIEPGPMEKMLLKMGKQK